MVLNKKYECQICKWKGRRTHLHHIIPKKNYGEDYDENLIELCPNCHSEACEDEQAFAKKHNLKGMEYSKEKIEALQKVFRYVSNNEKGKNQEIKLLYSKFDFDWIDCVAYVSGITRGSVFNTYLKDKQEGRVYRGVEV